MIKQARQSLLPIDAGTFWDTDYVVNPSLTDAMVALAEERLGVKLPVELIDLLRVQNGGYTSGFIFPMTVATAWADDHVPFDTLAGINLKDDDGEHNLLTSAYLTEEWELPERQVLLGGDGHYWISLDYRGEATEPAIAWLGEEFAEDVRIASSFNELLAGLVPRPEFEATKE